MLLQNDCINIGFLTNQKLSEDQNFDTVVENRFCPIQSLVHVGISLAHFGPMWSSYFLESVLVRYGLGRYFLSLYRSELVRSCPDFNFLESVSVQSGQFQ